MRVVAMVLTVVVRTVVRTVMRTVMRTAWVSTVWRLAMATFVAALREFCLDTLDLIRDDGLPFAEKGPFLAFFSLLLRA